MKKYKSIFYCALFLSKNIFHAHQPIDFAWTNDPITSNDVFSVGALTGVAAVSALICVPPAAIPLATATSSCIAHYTHRACHMSKQSFNDGTWCLTMHKDCTASILYGLRSAALVTISLTACKTGCAITTACLCDMCLQGSQKYLESKSTSQQEMQRE